MIFDRIENISVYENISANFKKACDFLKTTDFSNLPDEKTDFAIDGKEVYAFTQKFPNKETAAAKYETHDKYIDIQYVVSGSEAMFYAHRSEMVGGTGYDDVKDIEKFDGTKSEETELKVYAGQFAVFFPADGHKPCCKLEDGAAFKVVVKIKV